MSGGYWVYVNQPNNKALVHMASCSFCNDGRGMAEEKSRFNGEWRGPFNDPSLAMREALRAGKSTTRWCGICGRDKGVSGS